ncbi:MAG TPA: exo-alpha-sialidase [Anaerolineae bacterium]|nr:exo-alpha-sialidase [Anaerolineae bacterium]
MFMTKKSYLLTTPVALLMILGLLVYQTVNAAPAEPEETTSTVLWENGKSLTNSNVPQSAFQPDIATAPDGKTVLVSFLNETSGSKTNPYYVRSTDNGKTWSNPAQIYTNNGTEALFVNITFDVASGGHAVWVEDNLSLWYGKESQWSGNTSGSIHSIPVGPGNLIESPKIISNGTDKLHVVWGQQIAVDGDIYHMRSADGGNTWNTATVIANDNGALSLAPSLAADSNGVLHVVWETNISASPLQAEIFYTQSSDDGTTWSTPITISQKVNLSTRVFAQPKIIADGSSVYVAFENHPNVSQQKPYFAVCSSGCTNLNNWTAGEASPQVYSVHGSDPTFLKAQPALLGGCAITLFSGITGGSTEQIWENSNCNNWNSATSVSGVDAVLGGNYRAVRPSVATHNNWWLYLAFERKDGGSGRSDIYFVRNIPALYLPVILRSP